jgi:hypothetical protein
MNIRAGVLLLLLSSAAHAQSHYYWVISRDGKPLADAATIEDYGR